MRLAAVLLLALLAVAPARSLPPIAITAEAGSENAAAPAPEPTAPALPAVVAAPELSWTDATILGLVEGVTEFLPVSSTGHLIIANEFLGLEDTRQLTDAAGRPRWLQPPSPEYPAGRPLTIKEAADAYTVVIQVGGIAAVVVLYWGQLWQMALGVCGASREGLRLFRNIVLAVLPAAVLGLALEHWITEHLFSVGAVVAALVGGAILMLVVDRWRGRAAWHTAESRVPAELAPHEALLVGALQCVAMWPGTSRSMMTIVGGYLVGLSPRRAAEFSFLLGLPTLTGAALLKGYKTGPAMIEVFGVEPVLLGIGVAFVSAAIAIKVLVAMLTRFGLAPFAIYRLLLAAGLLFVMYR